MLRVTMSGIAVTTHHLGTMMKQSGYTVYWAPNGGGGQLPLSDGGVRSVVCRSSL